MDGRDWLHLTIGLVAAVLLLGCYWLATGIHRNGLLESCLARRGTNCEQFR